MGQFIYSGLDSGHIVVVVFLNSAMAFDSIDHSTLLSILATAGIVDDALSWLSSYLSGKSLTVPADGSTSLVFPLPHGIPQGSILGPVFFLVYINSFLSFANSPCPRLRAVSFADDSIILFSVRGQEPSIFSIPTCPTSPIAAHRSAWLSTPPEPS